MTSINLPPLCPVCGGLTALREMHRSSRGVDKVTCFFRCVVCSTDYPTSVDAADAQAAGLRPPAPSPKDEQRDPAS